ncbi:MAG: sulfotransferase family 2 domain-containing protein [Pseudomonadota bacterium]
MPFFRVASKLVYFAHVPKCAGSAIENYVGARFGTVAFLDRFYLSQPMAARWSKSSPQHIDAASLQRLIPLNLFDAMFAVVRHPATRLVSVYRFQRDIERSIPSHQAFPDWLHGLAEKRQANPFVYDNHIRPMSDLVPDNAKVFRLEDGLDSVVAWLDDLAGTVDGPRAVPIVNKSSAAQEGRAVRPSDDDLRLIAEIFAVDFVRFGYGGLASPPPSDDARSDHET